ncbi:MAG: hypothetical protein JSR46_07580 [Verrucomicrobia bacterium]|nr:hypothetical protein [Verrucomicrobiota bacterium]
MHLVQSQEKKCLASLDLLQKGEVDRLYYLSDLLLLSKAKQLHLNALIEAQMTLGLLEDSLQQPLGEAI